MGLNKEDKIMKAKVVGLTKGKMVYVRMMKRNNCIEIIDLSENERIALDLKKGDVVKVKQEVNNPYLVLIQE